MIRAAIGRSGVRPAASLLVVLSLVTPVMVVLPAQAARPVVVYTIGAVGDIAMEQFPHNNPRRCQYDDVSVLLQSLDLDAFLMLGDGQHNVGSLENYMAYYDPYFGPMMGITYPALGNHDYYDSPTAEGYFAYFHDRLAEITADTNGLRWGYYSFDLGTWHIICLNSRLGHPWGIPWSPDSPGPAELQFEWLKADLASHPNKRYSGTIVYLHHPYYDWETYWTAEWFSDEFTWQLPIWELLYRSGVDLVLGGHNHNYQRWAPQDPYGNYDPKGVRQIVAGTGGAYLWAFNHPPRPENLLAAIDFAFGAVVLTLRDGSYDIRFISVDGTVLDQELGVKCN